MVHDQKKVKDTKDSQRFQRINHKIQEENNFLKSKNEILISMIAEVYSEYKLSKDLNKK
jgi:hypothetical protein